MPRSTAAPAWTRHLLPVALALAGVVLLLNLISFAFGVAPLSTLRAAMAGTWGTPYGAGQVLFKATPLVFTGLAFEVGFRAGLFNIGAEGQLLVGALAATAIGVHCGQTPGPLLTLVMLAAGGFAGAGWGWTGSRSYATGS